MIKISLTCPQSTVHSQSASHEQCMLIRAGILPLWDYRCQWSHSPAWNHKTALSKWRSMLHWPQQLLPMPEVWKQWDWAIHMLYTRPKNSNHLLYPLTTWIGNMVNTNMRWDWHINPHTCALYQWHNTQWTVQYPSNICQTYIDYPTAQCPTTLSTPESLSPATQVILLDT